MQKKIFQYFIGGFFMLLSQWGLTQDQWMLNMPTFHNCYINPAHQLVNKLEIGLPSASWDVNTGGINLKDAISKGSDGINRVSLDNIVGNLQDQHPFNAGININSLDIAFKIKSLNIFLGHGVRHSSSFSLDKDLADIIVNGNAAYIGKTVPIDIKGHSTTNQQFYVGVSRKIGKLAMGMKLRYINGAYDIRSEDSRISLTTSEDYYQITLDNNIRLLSSGVIDYPGNIEDISLNIEPISGAFTSNSGYGIDLGLSYQLNKSWSVMASVLDFGSMTWSEQAKEFTNNKKTTVKGVNLETIIDGGETEEPTDSLLGALELTQVITSYKTKLNTQFNLGAMYNKNGYTISGIFQNISWGDHSVNALTIQASKKIGKLFNVGLSYGIKGSSYNNIGLLLHASLGPVNLFAASHNIFSVFDARRLNGLNARIGLSLAFGRPKIKIEENQY